nr:hypothetical protein [Tanacetum cinerariifolium]
MTIGLDLPRQILNAETEARKPENIKEEDIGVWAFKICLGRSKPMVITKARTLNGGSRSFLLKASATTFAFLR